MNEAEMWLTKHGFQLVDGVWFSGAVTVVVYQRHSVARLHEKYAIAATPREAIAFLAMDSLSDLQQSIAALGDDLTEEENNAIRDVMPRVGD